MKCKNRCFITLLLILVMFLSCTTYMLYGERKAYKKQAEQLENTVSHIGMADQTKTVVKTDKGNVTVTGTEPMKATEKNIESRYDEEIKVVHGASGTRPKDVDEISHIETCTSDSVTAPVKVEPFGGLSTHFEDGFTTIDVRIDTAKTAFISYAVRDSIVVVEYSRRHSILFGLIKWKSRSRVEAYSKNHRSEVTSFEVIQRIE